MAIEVGDKKITVEMNEHYVDFEKLDHKVQKTTQFLLKDLKTKLDSGLSFEEAQKMIEQDFELDKIKWWDKEQSIFWGLVNKEPWKKKLGLVEQGFTTKIENGERIRIPHYSLSSDLDNFEDFIISILKELKGGLDK